MYEFDSVSVSTYEASSLAAKLTEKSAEGWDVVAVVPTGSEITAFLRRTAASTVTEASTEAAPAETSVSTTTTPTASEPAGWGSAPEATTTGSTWGATADSGATSASSAPADSGTGTWGSAATAPAAAAPVTPTVPAGWYADPATRYELRYWDGSAWTEHVSRAGQQYTDPPVA